MKQSGDIFRKLKEDITAYVEVKFELLKLNTYERTGKVLSILSYGTVLLFLVFFALWFLFFTLGLFLGTLIGSTSAGFAIIVFIYIVAIALIILNKSRIITKIQNVIIGALIAHDDNNNETEHTREGVDPVAETEN